MSSHNPRFENVEELKDYLDSFGNCDRILMNMQWQIEQTYLNQNDDEEQQTVITKKVLLDKLGERPSICCTKMV